MTFMRAGLTLLELLVVIAAIGIVLAVSYPLFGYGREAARRSTCAQNLGAIQKVITMYETDFSVFPIRPQRGAVPGDAQEALNLLYRAYTDDVRIFSCPSKPLSMTVMDGILPCTAAGWPGSGGASFSEAVPGVTGYSTSYGYSPGHNSSNSRVIIMADRQGDGPLGNSDNHGRDVGQNVVSAGGSVEFRSGRNARLNDLGLDDLKRTVVDSDIFTGNTITPSQHVDWDSNCR